MRDYDRTPYAAAYAQQQAAIGVEIERLIRERPIRQAIAERRTRLENLTRLAELDARGLAPNE